MVFCKSGTNKKKSGLLSRPLSNPQKTKDYLAGLV